MTFNNLIFSISRMRNRSTMAGRKPRYLWLGPDARQALSEESERLEKAGLLVPCGNPYVLPSIMGLVWLPMRADGVALAFE